MSLHDRSDSTQSTAAIEPDPAVSARSVRNDGPIDSILAASLWDRIDALRSRPHGDSFEKLVADDLADSLEAEIRRRGVWCIICGSVDGVPHAGPTKPGNCICGATRVPDVVVRGILAELR